MKKECIGLLLLVSFLFLGETAVWGADIEITSFYPSGERGLFWDDEQVQVTLNGVNNTGSTQSFTINFVVTDFWDNQIGATVVEAFTDIAPSAVFSRTVNLGVISNNHGWFCVRATVMQGATEIDQKAAGFCVFEEGTSIDDGDWHHVAFVWNGSCTELYFDGELVHSALNVTGQINTQSNWHIAKGGWVGGNDFCGQIDDVRIYNRALTEKEIYFISR